MLFGEASFCPQVIMTMHEILGSKPKKSRASFVMMSLLGICLFEPSAASPPVLHHLVAPFADGFGTLAFLFFGVE